MKFIQTHRMGGDCTALFDVKDYHEIVADFVGEVLKQNEWGYIFIDSLSIEYKYTSLRQPIACHVLSKHIASVHSVGGWGRMDYYITTKRQ